MDFVLWRGRYIRVRCDHELLTLEKEKKGERKLIVFANGFVGASIVIGTYQEGVCVYDGKEFYEANFGN